VRAIIAVLIAFVAGVVGTIVFYTNGGRIIAWGTELGPPRVVTMAPALSAPSSYRPPTTAAPRAANPVRTIEEDGKPAAPPPSATTVPASGASAVKEPQVPADALNILGVVIVWPDL
jgi:hypothetical protein